MRIHPTETSLISQQYNTAFAASILDWAAVNGRHDLPWQNPRTAYRVWISEIMLQQTQVDRVKDFFDKFMTRFPSLEKLAEADSAEVMPYWAGLGYYARARNLHKTARTLLEDGQTSLPDSIDALVELPGSAAPRQAL
jgi:A/G-specific adenine glycosylase